MTVPLALTMVPVSFCKKKTIKSLTWQFPCEAALNTSGVVIYSQREATYQEHFTHLGPSPYVSRAYVNQPSVDNKTIPVEYGDYFVCIKSLNREARSPE